MNTINFKIENNIYTLKKVSGDMWCIANLQEEQEIDLLHLALIMNYMQKDIHEIFIVPKTFCTIEEGKTTVVKLFQAKKIRDEKPNTFNDFVFKGWTEGVKQIDEIHVDRDLKIYVGEFNPFNYYKMLPLLLNEYMWRYEKTPVLEVFSKGFDYPLDGTLNYFLENNKLPKRFVDFAKKEESKEVFTLENEDDENEDDIFSFELKGEEDHA